MRYEIVLSPAAIEDLRSLKAHRRAAVRDAIETHLRHEARTESRSSMKRLRGISHPQFRLRVDEPRVYYDVSENTVEILGIVFKSEAEAWLERLEKESETSGTGRSQE